MRRALLLACLSLGPAAASPSQGGPSRVGEPPRGSFTLVAQMERARPTLDLLVTVRLLDGLLEGGALVLDPPARAELAEALSDLPTRPSLTSPDTELTLARVREALTGPQRDLLDGARADLERRANLNLGRVRFATPDGPASVALLRYGFMLPGGFRVAREVAGHPEFNPYAQDGANAATLERVLTLLRG